MSKQYNFKQADDKQFHELANMLPMLEGKLFDDLAEDIFVNGLLEPITLLDDKILDGRNRYNACKLTKTQPRFIQWKSKKTPIDFVISKNLKRRHLNESQRAMVAADLATFKKHQKKSDRQICPSQKTQGETAVLLNVSPRSVKNAKTVKNKGTPELNAKVKQGEIAVSTAAQIAKLPKAEQKQITELNDRKQIIKETKTKTSKRKKIMSDDALSLWSVLLDFEKSKLKIVNQQSILLEYVPSMTQDIKRILPKLLTYFKSLENKIL